jgi:hypothetical protein
MDYRGLVSMILGWSLILGCSSDRDVIHPQPLPPPPTDAALEVSAIIAAAPPESPHYCIAITVRNPNSLAKTWDCADCCRYVVEVFFPQGGTARAPEMCCDHVTSQTFAPGEVFTEQVCWYGPIRLQGHDEPAPPGTYWAIAGLSHGGSSIDLGDSIQVTIR